MLKNYILWGPEHEPPFFNYSWNKFPNLNEAVGVWNLFYPRMTGDCKGDKILF